MRAEIRDRLQKGDTVDQIVDSFVARYGKKVLSAPTTRGFDLSAWIMPFVILCFGLVVVVWVAVRMARPTAETVEPEPPAVDPRVEEELKEFEKES
jgi:cytochrome c-type biogenesis protein CcmH